MILGFVNFFLFYQAVNRHQALVVQKASRSLGPRRVARGGGAQAQRLLPRNLPSASPQTHSRYLQHSETCIALQLLLMLTWTHRSILFRRSVTLLQG